MGFWGFGMVEMISECNNIKCINIQLPPAKSSKDSTGLRSSRAKSQFKQSKTKIRLT